ncbi:hypothetical protein DFH07DRAFT_726414 [Mycena maculata]|uniref:Uncharacterized protein n=1 Tax=Mycena maculata TaxID=230809 RepID=A0AAD7P2L9_9AGAR|nr:hypothetical protein DFH07DRAFT_726414 [Mycena maculata]
MAFFEYVSPPSSLKYSPSYFTSLTFLRAASLDYPSIASTSIIEHWCFSNEVPTTASGTLIQPGELIPRVQDLLPISREMQQAFAAGYRSVDVVLNHAGHRTGLCYHFSKIRLLIAINNHHAAVLAAGALYQHVITSNLLSSADAERFGNSRITTPISGFQVTDFPLWKLGCLLGEAWLEEDVVNALLELLYFHNAMNSNDDPSFIILPTSFSNDLQFLFGQTPRLYSSNFDLIRRRLRALPSATVSWIICESNHYSGYRYGTNSPHLRLGDSMGRLARADDLPSFTWLTPRPY